MLKNFDLRSYVVGLLTGLVLLGIAMGMKMVLLRDSAGTRRERYLQNDSGRSGGLDNPERLQRMAEQLDMSVEDLQRELDAGKTLPELFKEHGVEWQGGFRRGERGYGSGSLKAPAGS
ncbi:hypothetical protein HYW84_04355 [Candidatus Peregrinibacteria bacterium]|nr:hypothetical protein [Candidatus Peregrinibacteria bacterium]MBI2636525.1 hypothetical protein [Candidatus Peregrinibacteria bacterium]